MNNTAVLIYYIITDQGVVTGQQEFRTMLACTMAKDKLQATMTVDRKILAVCCMLEQHDDRRF